MAEETGKAKYIFGPVPSRRLGNWLGLDLVPCKTCTYDCIYCSLGSTTLKTLQKKEWVPASEVIAELKDILPDVSPDYIAISGSGEPTLHSKLGEIVDELKMLSNVPVAILTNGSLLWDTDVRDAVKNADLLIPSLDAATEAAWRIVDQPHEDLSFAQMLEGLLNLKAHFAGEVWLEVFLLAGLTATESEIPQLIDITNRMNFDRIQLNTVARPPSKQCAFPVPYDQMLRYSARFGQNAEAVIEYD